MLDDRSRQVLFAVIQCHINSPGPVGSRMVTKKYSFGLSPATIRNIMSDLEEMGYLLQPHTSAGRVPTESGYRYYVDAIRIGQQDPAANFVSELNLKLDRLRKDVNTVLDEASRMLSSMSHYIGLTISPDTGGATLSRIELIKFRTDQLAVILFTDEGMLRNKVVSISPETSQNDLNRMADYLNSKFVGLSLNEIKNRIGNELREERGICDRLISEAMKISSYVFSSSPADIYISGISEMLALPDFYDIGRIKELLRAIEDKHIIMKLLDNLAESEGTQIFIGSENPLDEMKNFSLVASTYKEGGKPVGAVGIIGPTRMNYAHAISIVDLTANFITEVLSYR